MARGKNMNTQYITKYVNEYGQIDTKQLLIDINEKCNFRLYRIAEQLINELYEIYTGTEYENINNDLFVLDFDDETEMFLLIDKIAKHININVING